MKKRTDDQHKRRRRRTLRFAAPAAACSVVISGCAVKTPTDASGAADTIKFSSNVVASNLDPAAMDSAPAADFVDNVYDPLLTYDTSSGQFVPSLAEKWTAGDDARAYTFTLRSGVKFHDGSALTAQGVKTSMERMMDIGKGYSFMLSGVKKISAPSDLQLVVTLKEPDVAFLNELTKIYIPSAKAVADHAGTDKGQQWFGSNEAGSGPYALASYTPNNKIVLQKFAPYWRGWSGKHASRYEITVTDPATQTLNMKQGTADVADAISVQDVASLKKQGGFTVATNLGAPFYLGLNLQSPRLQNRAVRQAISLAIPYDQIIKNVMLGYAARLNGPVPDWMQAANKGIPPINTDVGRASQLMQSAGYSKSKRLKLNLLYFNGLAFEKTMATVVQSALAGIGIDLTVQGVPWPTFTAKAENASTRPDLGVLAVAASTPNPGSLLSASFDRANQGSYKYWGYTGAATKLIRDGLVATTADEQNRLFGQAQAELANAYAMVWLIKYPRLVVTRSNVKNVVLDPTLQVFDFYAAYRAK